MALMRPLRYLTLFAILPPSLLLSLLRRRDCLSPGVQARAGQHHVGEAVLPAAHVPQRGVRGVRNERDKRREAGQRGPL